MRDAAIAIRHGRLGPVKRDPLPLRLFGVARLRVGHRQRGAAP